MIDTFHASREGIHHKPRAHHKMHESIASPCQNSAAQEIKNT